MPYGAIVTESILSNTPRKARHKIDNNTARQGHLLGYERDRSGGNFAGVMRALLKSSPSAPTGSRRREMNKGEGESTCWQPRTALDLSGHSFSKALKAEITRSQQRDMPQYAKSIHTFGSSDSDINSDTQTQTAWWEKNATGHALDEPTLSRMSSTSTLPASPPERYWGPSFTTAGLADGAAEALQR